MVRLKFSVHLVILYVLCFAVIDFQATAQEQPDQRKSDPLLGQRDESKPVPEKAEAIRAWQQRQGIIKSFRFNWTEQQVHPKGWIANPRFPERERFAIPTLLIDRKYTVSKSLAVDSSKMRYAFEIDRGEEPDGVEVFSSKGDNKGLGVKRKYSYLSVFNGHICKVSFTSLTGIPPPTIRYLSANPDAQNLDDRVILMAFRPLDSTLGDLLIERAVTNEHRTYYKGKSTFLLEERHDPSGWKMLLWIEPERDFLISRIMVSFEQKRLVDIDVEYLKDERWGWIPNRWTVTEMLQDGSRRLVSEATVSSYSINEPIKSQEFQ
jgi:hypothetical protein